MKTVFAAVTALVIAVQTIAAAKLKTNAAAVHHLSKTSLAPVLFSEAHQSTITNSEFYTPFIPGNELERRLGLESSFLADIIRVAVSFAFLAGSAWLIQSLIGFNYAEIETLFNTSFNTSEFVFNADLPLRYSIIQGIIRLAGPRLAVLGGLCAVLISSLQLHEQGHYQFGTKMLGITMKKKFSKVSFSSSDKKMFWKNPAGGFLTLSGGLIFHSIIPLCMIASSFFIQGPAGHFLLAVGLWIQLFALINLMPFYPSDGFLISYFILGMLKRIFFEKNLASDTFSTSTSLRFLVNSEDRAINFQTRQKLSEQEDWIGLAYLADALYRRGVDYLDISSFCEAQLCYEKVLAVTDEDSAFDAGIKGRIHYRLGLIYLLLGSFAASREQFNKGADIKSPSLFIFPNKYAAKSTKLQTALKNNQDKLCLAVTEFWLREARFTQNPEILEVVLKLTEQVTDRDDPVHTLMRTEALILQAQYYTDLHDYTRAAPLLSKARQILDSLELPLLQQRCRRYKRNFLKRIRALDELIIREDSETALVIAA